MAPKFLSRNGEIYRALHQDEDVCWMISFDDPEKPPFCMNAAELESFQPVPMPQDFVPENCDLSPAAQERLALIQPLLDQNLAAMTDHQLRLSVAKEIADKRNTTVRRVLRLYYRYLATGKLSFSKKRESGVNNTYDWAIKNSIFQQKGFL